MMAFNEFTDPVTEARMNFKVTNTKKPAAIAPAIGKPTSATRFKKLI
jgi:hypothetical protein